MPDGAIRVQQLSKVFVSGADRVSVLDALSFEVQPGESIAVVGRSDSGKSTLLNLLCGLDRPDSGELEVNGLRNAAGPMESADSATARWATLRRQSIGVVFQDANLMPALTLEENVRLRANLAGQPGGGERHWLEQLGVGAEAERFPDQVSGGQRQRAALAMVFAMQPSVILADEPTGSLDRHTAEEVAHRLFEVQQETGCTLVLATHDQELAQRCGRQLDLGGG